MKFSKHKGKIEKVFDIHLDDASDSDLMDISSETSVGLSLDEMKKVKDHFRTLDRPPTDIELQALGQAWSEHCCYKSSKTILRPTVFSIEAQQNMLVISEDAGVVEFDDDHAYVVALESHNHPSAIEPYGGAATGIGGIVRDVVCMGATPIAFIDPLFFGPLDLPWSEVPKGAKHPRYLLSRVVAGIRDYGNRIGVPTCAGMVSFHPGYIGNCLVNVGCVGIVPKKKIIRSRVKKPNSFYILAGGRTGRDGIHGVTFASAELDEASEESSRGAVQLGDPITKEPLIHACLEANDKGLLEGMKDLGGGGLSCVAGEMALAGGYGCIIDLEKVPLKEKGLAPWEVWVSESQERMMVAVDPKDIDSVLGIFNKWDVEANVVGEVIPEKKLFVRSNGDLIFEMDLEFLTTGPEYNREYEKRERIEDGDPLGDTKEPSDYNQVLLALLGSEAIASREWIIRQYDHEVGARTVLKPLQGHPFSPVHGDSPVLKPLPDSWKGLAISADVNPYLTELDPYWGSASAVDEIFRNIVAVGANPHSLADCLNFGNPEKKDRLGDFAASCEGLTLVAKSCGVPFISGNVSFYNETPSGSIPPTPSLLGVGIIDDIRSAVTVDLKEEGNIIYLIGRTSPELAGSEYWHHLGVSGKEKGQVPKVDPQVLKTSMESILNAMSACTILSCHDLSEGGLGVAIAEMCIGGGRGAKCELSQVGSLRPDATLFSESNTRWLVEVPPHQEESFSEHMKGCEISKLGTVEEERLEIFYHGDELINIPLSDMRQAWKMGLNRFIEGD